MCDGHVCPEAGGQSRGLLTCPLGTRRPHAWEHDNPENIFSWGCIEWVSQFLEAWAFGDTEELRAVRGTAKDSKSRGPQHRCEATVVPLGGRKLACGFRHLMFMSESPGLLPGSDGSNQGVPACRSCLLTSAWPTPRPGGHLGTKPRDGRELCPYLSDLQ